MFGYFQQSQLRIEVNANATTIGNSVLHPGHFRQWLWPQQFSSAIPEPLQVGSRFQSSLGLITIQHVVDIAESNCLRFLLSQGVDGYHEWYWGEGWVQSRLEGISLLPLNLAQTYSLLKLQQFLQAEVKGRRQ